MAHDCTKWSEKHIAIVREQVLLGKSDEAIARMVGRSPEAVRHKRHQQFPRRTPSLAPISAQAIGREQ
jgi:hypothetical protein